MTKDNKKLLEAANLIKENCKNLKLGSSCPFGKVMDICDGDINCTLANSNLTIPKDWNIPRVSRWPEKDIALAKALIEFGATKIYRVPLQDFVVYDSKNGYFSCNNRTPEDAFNSLNSDEIVYLKDVVAEGENGG